MKKLLFFLLILYSIQSYSQVDYNWWNRKNNWDGVSRWSSYLIFSPAFMGPNALPVPECNDGSVQGNASLEFSLEGHYSKGDDTKDIYTRIFLPLFSDRVGLNLSMVPIEFYKIDTITRDLRRSREYDGKGTSFGDVYVSTFIQLVKNRNYLPDVLISFNLKTASGGNVSAARYTDSPGYYFDVSFGKDISLNNSLIKSVRPFVLGGLYIWQTNREDYFQDDAILYGAGFNLLFAKIELKNYFGGYYGYIGNGDRPAVYRLTLRSRTKSPFNYKISFQQGINDYMYSSLRLGFEINFNYNKKAKFV